MRYTLHICICSVHNKIRAIPCVNHLSVQYLAYFQAIFQLQNYFLASFITCIQLPCLSWLPCLQSLLWQICNFLWTAQIVCWSSGQDQVGSKSRQEVCCLDLGWTSVFLNICLNLWQPPHIALEKRNKDGDW